MQTSSMVTGYLVPARDSEAEIGVLRSRFLATLERGAPLLDHAEAGRVESELRNRGAIVLDR